MGAPTGSAGGPRQLLAGVHVLERAEQRRNRCRSCTVGTGACEGVAGSTFRSSPHRQRSSRCCAAGRARRRNSSTRGHRPSSQAVRRTSRCWPTSWLTWFWGARRQARCLPRWTGTDRYAEAWGYLLDKLQPDVALLQETLLTPPSLASGRGHLIARGAWDGTKNWGPGIFLASLAWWPNPHNGARGRVPYLHMGRRSQSECRKARSCSFSCSPRSANLLCESDASPPWRRMASRRVSDCPSCMSRL